MLRLHLLGLLAPAVAVAAAAAAAVATKEAVGEEQGQQAGRQGRHAPSFLCRGAARARGPAPRPCRRGDTPKHV